MRKAVLGLLSAFFFSCETDTDIALPVDSAGNKAIFTDSLRLEYGTYLIDSVITSGQNFGLVGEATDPIFGKITATTFLQPSLRFSSTTNEAIPFTSEEALTPDSLILRLSNRNLLFYGDSTQILNMGLYRLKESLKERNYNNDDRVITDKDPISIIRINLKRFINNSDSTVTEIRIPMPQELLTEVSALLGTEEAKDASKFKAKFRGFALRPIVGTNVILGLDLQSVSSGSLTSGLTFYAHTADDTQLSYTFELGSTRFTQILADRSSTMLAGLTNKKDVIPPLGTDKNIYIQAGTGLAAWLRLPGVQKLDRTVKIAKAVVSWEVDETSRSKQFGFSPILVPMEIRANGSIRRDALSNYSYIDLSRNSTVARPYFYSDSLNKFSIDITSYVRDLVLKNDPDNGVIFAAGSLAADGSNSNAVIFNAGLNRVILRKPKLELYYTK